MNTIEDPEKLKHLPERVRKGVCSGEGVILCGLSGYDAHSDRTNYVTLFHTDGRWFLSIRGEERNLVNPEEIDNMKDQDLLCATNLYPRPYWSLANLGISSLEEVEEIYSAKKYSSYQTKPSGFGGISEILHHTSDGRWLLLIVVDDDTDPSRTLYNWNVVTEEAAHKWLAAHNITET